MSGYIPYEIEISSDDSDREKYENFFNLGARKFHFPKYKKFLFVF